jgi:hypothetical protein
VTLPFRQALAALPFSQAKHQGGRARALAALTFCLAISSVSSLTSSLHSLRALRATMEVYAVGRATNSERHRKPAGSHEPMARRRTYIVPLALLVIRCRPSGAKSRELA